ncbi:MAG: hypothetical protein ACFFCQ_09635 [Promethearchaeota archaeon]
MKFRYILGIVSGLTIIVGFIAVQAYPPGSAHCNTCHTAEHYAACSSCHNDPAFAPVVNDSSSPDISAWPEDSGQIHPVTGRWSQNFGIWSDLRNYSRNYVYMMPSDNTDRPTVPALAFEANSIHYVQMQFMFNSTHLITRVRIKDLTMNTTGITDKFAIIWNIDAESAIDNFIYHNGQMKTESGKLDMWFWDASTVLPNSTGKAKDMYIDEVHYHDDTTQDVDVGAHWGKVFENPMHEKYFGYWIYFARELTTEDPNDAQFVEGVPITYSIAYWNGSVGNDHLSSWEHTLILGDTLGYVYTHTETVTETEKSIPAIGFVGVVASVSIIAAAPLIARWMQKKKRNR